MGGIQVIKMQNSKMRIELAASKKDAALKRADIKKIVKAAAAVGIDTIKLVGDDPLENSDITKIVKDIKGIEGIKEVSLTTNGRLLEGKATELKEAGLSRVNINIDTLQHYRYVGGDLNDVVNGINAATNASLKPVRFNVSVQKGYNDDEIIDFVQLTFQHGYEIRFIEMSEEEEKASSYDFISCEDMKKKLPALRSAVLGEDKMPLEKPSVGTADIYKYPGAIGKICFIEKRADDFMSRCAAVTVKKDGTATCPCGKKVIDIKSVIDDEEALKEAIKNASL